MTKVIVITGSDEQLHRELSILNPCQYILEPHPGGTSQAIHTMHKARELSKDIGKPVVVGVPQSPAPWDDNFPGSRIYLAEADVALKLESRDRCKILKVRTSLLEMLT